MKLKHVIGGLAISMTALTAVGVAPVSAKSQALSPATCTGSATANLSYAKVSGGRYNVGISTTTYGQWNVKVLVDGAQATSYTMPSAGPGLNYIAVLNPAKGKHAFEVIATNLTTGDTCTAYVPPGA